MNADTRLLLKCEKVMMGCKNEKQQVVGRRYCDLAYRTIRKDESVFDDNVMEAFFTLKRIKNTRLNVVGQEGCKVEVEERV
jgi:hypothetical protein